ncbi:MAG TPA: hypothetical protein VJ889_12850 [Pseudomonas sp.]|nr:hypothetical protein [Pseudomonas sp.]
MRYMKVTVQDRDTVHFQFYENDQLQREATVVDRQRLKVFGKTYLKCAWYNADEDGERHLRIFSQNPSGDGMPETVRLHFHDGSTIAYKAAVRDLDNDGVFELILSSDVDNDGRANRTDRNRVKTLANEFLKLDWR